MKGRPKRPPYDDRLYTQKTIEEIKRYFESQGLSRYQMAKGIADRYSIKSNSAIKWLRRSDSKIKPSKPNGKIRYFKEHWEMIMKLRK